MVEGKIGAGQAPGNQPKNNEPGVIQRDLYPQYPKELESFHPGDPFLGFSKKTHPVEDLS
jgi:hypothetical protein